VSDEWVWRVRHIRHLGCALHWFMVVGRITICRSWASPRRVACATFFFLHDFLDLRYNLVLQAAQEEDGDLCYVGYGGVAGPNLVA
jgi:hypothetical protein